jgi:hypothetical protein
MAVGRIEPNDRTVFRAMEQGAGGVLLHLDSGEYRQLNQTGALIWSLLEKHPTRAELLEELRTRIEEPPATLEQEVDVFLKALADRELVTVAPE